MYGVSESAEFVKLAGLRTSLLLLLMAAFGESMAWPPCELSLWTRYCGGAEAISNVLCTARFEGGARSAGGAVYIELLVLNEGVWPSGGGGGCCCCCC